MLDGTKRPSRLLPVSTPDDCAREVVDAVQRNRFEVWVPSNQWVGIKLGNLVPRAARERAMLAMGVAKIAGQADQSARRSYHERAFASRARLWPPANATSRHWPKLPFRELDVARTVPPVLRREEW